MLQWRIKCALLNNYILHSNLSSWKQQINNNISIAYLIKSIWISSWSLLITKIECIVKVQQKIFINEQGWLKSKCAAFLLHDTINIKCYCTKILELLLFNSMNMKFQRVKYPTWTSIQGSGPFFNQNSHEGYKLLLKHLVSI